MTLNPHPHPSIHSFARLPFQVFIRISQAILPRLDELNTRHLNHIVKAFHQAGLIKDKVSIRDGLLAGRNDYGDASDTLEDRVKILVGDGKEQQQERMMVDGVDGGFRVMMFDGVEEGGEGKRRDVECI